MKRTNLTCGLLAPFALAVVGPSCSVDRETQITVAISSETEIPTELDSFTVSVIGTRTGELRLTQTYFPKSGREFPTTLAVVPIDEDSLESPVRVEVTGQKGTDVLLRRSAVMSYFQGRNLLLAMPLRMACFQFKDCGPTATCAGGECVDARISPDDATDYSSEIVSPSAASCFDEQRCLDHRQLVEVAEDCSFVIPTSEPVNVAIRWAAAPNRLLTLEANDAQEGFTRPDPGRGKLSRGACDSHFQRRGPDGALLVADWAKEVYVATGCPEKTRLVPFCYSPTTGHAGIGAVFDR